MAPQQYSTHAAFAAGVVGTLSLLAYYLYKRSRNQIPKRWKPVGVVSKMYMYPLKSGRRLEIQKANCTERGFQSTNTSLPHFKDRCLVIYQESSKEVKTGRNYPKILLIEVTAVDETHFCLSASGVDSITFEVPDQTAKTERIRVHNAEILSTRDCGNEVSKWISNYILNQPTGLRLGFYDDNFTREIGKYYPKEAERYPKVNNPTAGQYTDIGTIHLLTKPSVDDLRSRISNSDVTYNNFRPNILIDGEDLAPYAEDNWDWIKIGDIVARKSMPCPRCLMTTINPEAATFSKDYEPVATMRKYRPTLQFSSEPPSPVMGMYARLYKVGQLCVGDVVYIGEN